MAQEFEPALIQELKTISSLQSTWVSTVTTWNTADRSWGLNQSNRVQPLTSSENTARAAPPFVIFSSSEGVRSKSLGGYQVGKKVDVELNVVAKRYAEMKRMTKDIINLLVGMEQREIGTGGPFIQELTYKEPVEIYEPAPDLYRCIIDFEVYF